MTGVNKNYVSYLALAQRRGEKHYDKMNKVEVVIMIVDPLSGGHNGNSEDHLPPSVKFLFK